VSQQTTRVQVGEASSSWGVSAPPEEARGEIAPGEGAPEAGLLDETDGAEADGASSFPDASEGAEGAISISEEASSEKVGADADSEDAGGTAE